MASVNIQIQRDNGTNISASGIVPDELIAETAELIGALLFDSVSQPTPASDGTTPTAQ